MEALFELDFVIKRLKKVLIITKLLLVVLVLFTLPFLISRLDSESDPSKKLHSDTGSNDTLFQILSDEHQLKTNLLFVWIGTLVIIDALGTVAINCESIPFIVVEVFLKMGLIIFAFAMGTNSYAIISIMIIVFTVRLVVLLEKRMRLEDELNQQIQQTLKVRPAMNSSKP